MRPKEAQLPYECQFYCHFDLDSYIVMGSFCSKTKQSDPKKESQPQQIEQV
jgi:hypothetical protein